MRQCATLHFYRRLPPFRPPTPPLASSDPNVSDIHAPIIDYSADFNVIGVEVNETSVRFYVNNQTNWVFSPAPQGSTNYTWGKSPYTPVSKMYGILNLAIADMAWACSQPINVTGWAEPQSLLVDWVKAYQFVPTCTETTISDMLQ